MRKNNLQVTAWCVVLAVCAGCQQREIKNLSSRGKNIICFGDSLTYGYGVEHGEDYPSLLAKLTRVPVINAGKSGETSPQGIQRLDKEVLQKDPRLVCIEFGGNDFLTKVPLSVTLENIESMVDQIQARGAAVALVDVSAGPLFQDYQSPLRRLASEKGAIFIPNVFHGIITNPSMKSDFFHPNRAGYALVAERIYLGIKPFLKKREDRNLHAAIDR